MKTESCCECSTLQKTILNYKEVYLPCLKKTSLNIRKNMKKISNKTTKAIACAVIAIAIGATATLQASVAPWISPNYDYVIGEGKILDVYCGGGSSDEPDYEAPCPPWSLSSGTEVWNWTLSGPGSKSGDENQITVTSTGVGAITVSVNRNDTYSDEKQPDPTTDSGVVSADSETLSVCAVKLSDPDQNKKLYFFGGPDEPFPYNVEQKRFIIINGENSPSVFTWTASPNRIAFVPADGAAKEEDVMAHAVGSNGPSETTIQVKWGSSEIDTRGINILYFGSIALETDYTNWWDYGIAQGYETHFIWLVKDQLGASIAGVGVNENFDYSQKTDHISNNWFGNGMITRNDDTSAAGYFEDQYFVTQRLGNLVPEPVDYEWLPNAASIRVVSVPQKYYIGSKASADGVEMKSHTVIYHRGYATVQN
jgi:hypothetical protein